MEKFRATKPPFREMISSSSMMQPPPTPRCPECGYDKYRNMGTHLFFVHGYSKARIQEWRLGIRTELIESSNIQPLVCGLTDPKTGKPCGKVYRRPNSLRTHHITCHNVHAERTMKHVVCPLNHCNFSTRSLLELVVHAQALHYDWGVFRIDERRFANIDQFNKWRATLEREQSCPFVIDSSNSNAADGTTLKYLKCARTETCSRKRRRERMEKRQAMGYPPTIRQRIPPPDSGRVSTMRRNRDRDLEEEQLVVDVVTDEGWEGHDGGGKAENAVPRPISRADRQNASTSRAPGGQDHQDRRRGPSEKPEEKQAEGEFIEVEGVEVDEEIYDDGERRGNPYDQVRYGRPSEHQGPYTPGGGEGYYEDDDDYDESLMYDDDMVRPRRHCTAHMRVIIAATGVVHVEYCLGHLGHPVDQTIDAQEYLNPHSPVNPMWIPPPKNPMRRSLLVEECNAIAPPPASPAIPAKKARRTGEVPDGVHPVDVDKLLVPIDGDLNIDEDAPQELDRLAVHEHVLDLARNRRKGRRAVVIADQAARRERERFERDREEEELQAAESETQRIIDIDRAKKEFDKLCTDHGDVAAMVEVVEEEEITVA